MKTFLCINPDGEYRVFLGDDKEQPKKTKDGYWCMTVDELMFVGIPVPEHCFAINYQGLNPGEGPFVLE